MGKEKKKPTLDRLLKVRDVREKLREKADAILDLYLDNVTEAKIHGEFAVANDALQWLLEHMPADAETGERIIDNSVDKQPKQVEKGPSGPNISIGFALGGLQQPKLLESPSVSVEVIEVKDE